MICPDSKPLKLAWLLVLAATSMAAASDTGFIEALRQRGLQRLAEVHCRRELNRDGILPRQAVALVGQLSLIEVDRALAAPLADQATHWQAAEEVIVDYLTSKPSQPENLLLKLQQALNTSQRAEATLLLAAAGQGLSLREAIASHRVAERQLDTVAESIEQARQAAAEKRQREPTFRTSELASLANRVDLARARVLVNVAPAYGAGSADLDDAVLRSAAITRRLCGQELPPKLLWQSRLLLAKAERLLGKAKAARRQFESWLAEGPELPSSQTNAVQAELGALVRAAAGQAAFDRWAASLSATHRASPEVRLLLLRDAMQRWREMLAGEAKNELLAAVQSQLATLRDAHGPRWWLRAQAIANPAMQASVEIATSDATPNSAEFLFRSGRLDQAVDAYDRSAAVAYRSGARGRAFEMALAAAAIRQSQQRWADAGKRFRRASLANATDPKAPVAHRSAAVCLAQTLKAAGDESSSKVDDYLELLNEHLATWPQAKSAAELRWWLIRGLFARQRWPELLDAARAVPTNDPQHHEAVKLIGQAWEAIAANDRLAGEAEKARTKAKQGAQQLQAIVLGDDSNWPATWTLAQREAALAAARLRLLNSSDAASARYATQMLQAAIAGPPKANQTWLSNAGGLLAAALVRQGELPAAAKIVDRQPAFDQRIAQPLLDELLKKVRSNSPQRREAAELLAQLLASLPKTSNEAWRLPYQAAALEATGQAEAALDAARKLAEREPDNANAQERFAGLLAGQPGEADRRAALAKWRSIESRSRGGTPRWFRARLARLRLMISLSDREAANKLLKLTRVLHPELGGMQAEFDAVEQQLD